MADAYCSSCGQALGFADQYCGRCGVSTGGAADSDATRADAYSPYRPGDPPPYPFPVAPTAQATPGPPRRHSPVLLVAVAALVVAVVAAGVTLLVVSGGNDETPAAAGSSLGTSVATSTPGPSSSPPTATPTLAQPQIVTVTQSQTLTAPNPPGDGEDPAPLSISQLRSYFESGTPVDPVPYEDADSTVDFSSPSGNIECLIISGSAGVQCAISRYDFSQPGPDCDNGALVSVDADGNATYSGCLNGSFVPGGTTLAYGASVTEGGFGCLSRSTGISCVDLGTDTGFTLSKQAFVPVN